MGAEMVETGSAFAGELSFALELAGESDEIAMRWFSRDPDVSLKEDGTLVTIADREIEQMLRRRIRDRFPGDAILGEEGGPETGGAAEVEPGGPGARSRR